MPAIRSRPFVLRSAGAFAVALLAACGGGSDPVEPEPTVAQVVAVTGSAAQTATVGAAVPIVPTVRVLSNLGQPMAGVTVAFSATGGGAPGVASAQTDAQGVASPGSWTLGTTAGANTLTASVGSLSVTFQATATAAAPTVLTATQVDGGTSFQCARRASGAVSCWGLNGVGQIGDGSTTFRANPVNLGAAGVTFASVTLGGQHGCALTAAGVAHCWGRNVAGALGDGTTTDRAAPVAIAGHAFVALALDETYSCGLKADGSVWCWGTRPGGSEQRLTPTRLTDGGRTMVAVAVSQARVCGAVAGGGTLCWTGDIFTAPAPSLENAGLTFSALVAGSRHQCGLTADNRAYCWGDNEAGQLGVGSTTPLTTATEVSGGLRFSAIDAGGQHTCGVATDGSAYCWGSNVYGQLGIDVLPTTTATASTPQRVVLPAGVTLRGIAGGTYATCAVATTNEVYCWGGKAFNNAGTALVAELKPTAVQGG